MLSRWWPCSFLLFARFRLAMYLEKKAARTIKLIALLDTPLTLNGFLFIYIYTHSLLNTLHALHYFGFFHSCSHSIRVLNARSCSSLGQLDHDLICLSLCTLDNSPEISKQKLNMHIQTVSFPFLIFSSFGSSTASTSVPHLMEFEIHALHVINYVWAILMCFCLFPVAGVDN